MKKKLLSKTYLRDVTKYEIKFDLSNDDYYLAVKKLIETKPFILTNGLKVMDKGYYILELLPKNENYSLRVYFNENKEILEYYIDISLNNGMDEECRIPYYDDLYIDITIVKDKVEVLDEDELEEALQSGLISKEKYELAHKVKNQLLKEIKDKSNKYINMDLKSLL
ncbi:MAG: DUF402 domain-containing protein [Mollicutes bacterium]|nr:DUF402 domain-containing protein [Mollicutes bacterium]